LKRHRSRLVFRHVSTHRTLSGAFQFARAFDSIAWHRETVGVVRGDDWPNPAITQRPDGLHELDLTFSYGPVIGGHLSDGRRIVQQAREVIQPVDEMPLEIIDAEREEVPE
jgi:hypothetical protein